MSKGVLLHENEEERARTRLARVALEVLFTPSRKVWT